ncbi:Mfa1 family fimbria major subunit [Bacteroides sp.]|uniref:Mfa1 family fimbria major subunit n=1 Tax=Bacteroides sp. TaxID=29523 RepID=UPI002580AE81|nr:Mfa1 family fimbria major subunit [Bacteroides sp.]
MGKNDFLIGVFALATMTFVACSNDDKLGEERSNGNGSIEVVEGEPTWAKFVFKLGKDGATRATGDTHEGTTTEKNIKNLRAYIFNESGSFEAKTDNVTVDEHGTEHTAVLKLTSGKKRVYVVANMQDEWITSTTTTTQFEAITLTHCTKAGRIAHTKGTEKIEAVSRVGNFDKISGNGNAETNGFLMANVLAATEHTLYPGISAENCSKPSYENSAEMERNNHLEVSISRAAAKLQATYANTDALTLKDNTDKTLGKLLTPTFTVRNLPVQSYMFLHNQNGFLTPFYTMTNTSSTFEDFAKYYDEVNEPDLDLKASTDGETIKSIYLPENSNQTPVRGNTTYVLVKGIFAPAANVMINNVTVEGTSGNLTIKNEFDETDYTTGGKVVPPYFIVPEWENQIYTAPADFTGNLAAYGLDMILKTYLNKAGKQKWLNAVDEDSAVDEGDIENPVSVYYGSSFSTSDGIYSVVAIKKYSHSKDALPGYKESVEGTIRIFQYTGGICYYRVNVEDNMDGKTEANNLFYSVMRNRFYNVNISRITSIGYPADEDVTVDPTDPINQKTYMQAHITVEPWTKVEQDAELGM